MMSLKLSRLSPAMRVVSLYALFSVAWILLSDRILDAVASDRGHVTLYQQYKGTAFVVVSAGLLYLLLRGGYRIREKAQRELVENEKRFRQAIYAAPFPSMIHADDGRIVDVNRAWLDATGYTPQDIATMEAWTQRAYGEDSDAVLQRIRGLYDLQQQSDVGDFLVRMADGRLRTWHFCAAPLGRDSAQRRLVISMAMDVTERRQTEDALRQAKEHAEAASKARDQFLAVLSHELRTPLTPVLAAVSVVDGTPPDAEEHAELMRMIRRNVELEARLIDDLLDLTRVTRGKVQLERRPVDLCSILAQVHGICQSDAQERGVRLSVQYPGSPLMVQGDSARLQQVFWNGLKNAIKFSCQGGLVEIHLGRDGDIAHVEIQDYGVGIDASQQARLFKPFEQAAPASAATGGGLGLGLTIARAMVELHGGQVTVNSDGLGKGAVFKVILPLLHEPEKPLPSPHCPNGPLPSLNARGDTRALHILLVEDHADTLRILQRLLQRQGHQVKTAGDVETALTMARAERFDLLLSDLGLPGRSGIELIRELRQEGNRMPAVAISGFGRDEDIRASCEAGFDEHLTKPIDFTRLQAVIARHSAGALPPR